MKYMMRTRDGQIRETAEHRPFVTMVRPSEIEIGPRILALDPENVAALVESYQETGVLATSWVRVVDGRQLVLIAGLTRLTVADQLRVPVVPCQLIECTDREAVELEVRENWNRRQVRGEARRTLYTRLVELHGGVVLSPDGLPGDGGENFPTSAAEPPHNKGREIPATLPNVQPHDKGISAAARELGVDPKDIRTAVKIEKQVTPEAKEAAREAGIIDTDSAMLEVAKVPADEQVAKVKEIKKRKPRRIAAGATKKPESVVGEVAEQVAAALAPSAAPSIIEALDRLIEQRAATWFAAALLARLRRNVEEAAAVGEVPPAGPPVARRRGRTIDDTRPVLALDPLSDTRH